MNASLLRVISILYLILPNIIFSAFWFRYQYSIPLLIGYSYLFLLEAGKRSKEVVKFSISDLSFLLIFALFWTFCTGIAGLSFQTYDYWAHNSKYYDLITNSWPIFFPEKNRFACYYFGYYLIPAFISKYINSISVFTLFIWSVLGFVLGLSWIYILTGKRKVFLLVFICFGGVGHTVKVILSNSPLYKFHFPVFLTEIWSTFDQSLCVPNQVIPSLIVTGLFLHDVFIRKRFEESFFSITLLFIWAVFPAIVLMVLYFFVFVKQVRYANLKSLFHNYLLPGLLFLPTFVYLASSNGVPTSGFIWQFEPAYEILTEHSIGTLIDLILYYVIYLKFKKEISATFPQWFIRLVFLTFLLMSFYRIGIMNDWMIRGSIPLIIIVSVLILRGIGQYLRTNQLLELKKFPMFVLFFLLCLVSPIAHIKRSLFMNVVVNNFNDKPVYLPIPYDKYCNTYCAIKDKFSEKEADQYVGKKQSPYELYLSRLP